MVTADKGAPRKLPPLHKGILVMWNDLKGFGFVRPDDGDEDHFIHISAFKKGMSRRPEIGDELRFRPDGQSGKKRAVFAVIQGVDYEPPPAPKPFSLMPKRRPWFINLLIFIPLASSFYLLIAARNPLPFFFYTALSLLTMFIYATDKANAATHRWRVPEGYLHILELMGGWPGALLAQNEFRHKTRKSLYQILFRVIIAVHLLGWAAYFYWHYRNLLH